MYRPAYWRNPYKAEYRVLRLDGTITTEPATEQRKEEHNAFEAGAEAMYKAVAEACPTAEDIRLKAIETYFGNMSFAEFKQWLVDNLLIEK